MKWGLDALKIIAKNETVPGAALRDAITEIEKLRTELKSKQIIIKSQEVRINELAKKLLMLA